MICGSLMLLLLLLLLLLVASFAPWWNAWVARKSKLIFQMSVFFPKGASQLVGHGMQQQLSVLRSEESYPYSQLSSL